MLTLQLRDTDNELAALDWQRELTCGQKYNMADKHLHPHLRQLVESRAELQQTATQLAQQTAYRPQPSQVAATPELVAGHEVLQRHMAVVSRLCDVTLTLPVLQYGRLVKECKQYLETIGGVTRACGLMDQLQLLLQALRSSDDASQQQTAIKQVPPAALISSQLCENS